MIVRFEGNPWSELGQHLVVYKDNDEDEYKRYPDECYEADDQGTAPPPEPTPTFTLTREEKNELVRCILTGPRGPSGPVGATGASA